MAWYKQGEKFWAYLAGFIDGDGTIAITNCKRYGERAGETYLQPTVQFSNTDKSVHIYLKKMLKNYNYYKQTSNHKVWKDRYHGKITRTACVERILKGILPYLVIKEDQATAVLDFIQRRKSEKYHGYSDEVWSIYEEVRELNKRGKI